jgi:hypothetical protein
MDNSQLLRVYIIEAAQGYAELSRIYIDRGDKASYYFLPMGDLAGGFATLLVEKSRDPVGPDLAMEVVARITPTHCKLLKKLCKWGWRYYIRDSRWREEGEDPRTWAREIVRSLKAQQVMLDVPGSATPSDGTDAALHSAS